MQDRLFRALAIARVVVTLNMVGLNAYRRDNYEHATAGLVIVTALVGWTALAIWLYASATRRTAGLLVVDLAVAVVAMGLTPIVKTEAFNATIPGFWVMGLLAADGSRERCGRTSHGCRRGASQAGSCRPRWRLAGVGPGPASRAGCGR